MHSLELVPPGPNDFHAVMNDAGGLSLKQGLGADQPKMVTQEALAERQRRQDEAQAAIDRASQEVSNQAATLDRRFEELERRQQELDERERALSAARQETTGKARQANERA